MSRITSRSDRRLRKPQQRNGNWSLWADTGGGVRVKTTSVWVPWQDPRRVSQAEQCTAYRRAVVINTRPQWSETERCSVTIEIVEPRKRGQRHSKCSADAIQRLAVDALVGPVIAAPGHGITGIHVTKRWVREDDQPGVWFRVADHEETP